MLTCVELRGGRAPTYAGRSSGAGLIEAALRERWNIDDLAVYGDLLLSRGDARGELIALDLNPAPAEAAWQARRGAALRAAFGNDLATRFGSWVQHGFVHEVREGLHPAALLGTSVGTFVRGCTTHGTWVEDLVAQPRPWLGRLVIGSQGTASYDKHVAALVANAPSLHELHVYERATLGDVPHSVRRITGPSTDRGPMVEDDELRLLLDAIATTPVLHELWTAYGALFDRGESLFSLVARLVAAGLVTCDGPIVGLTEAARAFRRGVPPRPFTVTYPAFQAGFGRWVLWAHADANGRSHRGVTDVGLLRCHGELIRNCLATLPLARTTIQTLATYLEFIAGLPTAGEWEPVDFAEPEALYIAVRQLFELEALSSFHGDGDVTDWSWLGNLVRFLDRSRGRRISFRVAWGF